MDAAGVIGELAASLELVPSGMRLSAAELLAGLESDRLEQALTGVDQQPTGTTSSKDRQA
jgi:hypothetical protein